MLMQCHVHDDVNDHDRNNINNDDHVGYNDHNYVDYYGYVYVDYCDHHDQNCLSVSDGGDMIKR